MTDTDTMPFGKYWGKEIGKVPPSYLKYIYDKGFVSLRKYNKVYWYIENNLEEIEAKIKC